MSQLYKEISLKSSNCNISVLQFCTTVSQRESIIPINQFSSIAQSCPTLSDPMHYSMPGFHVYHQNPDPPQTHVHWVSDAIQPSHPLSSPSPPALSLTHHQDVFQCISSSHQMVKSSALASVLPTNIQDWFPLEWSGVISLQSKRLSRILQHHSSKASVLWRSAFFMVQLSHPCMTTGKTISLSTQTFVCKGMSLFFVMLSTLLIAFLPRSKRFPLSWLKSTSAVILKPKKIKSVTVLIISPSICHEVTGLEAMIFVFWMCLEY